MLYVGSEGGVEAQLVARANLPYRAIATGQLRGRAPWVIARNLLRMGKGTWQMHHLLGQFEADVCLVTGGYVSAPVVLAARQHQVPVMIYLPDITPGLAVRALGLLAQRVAVSVPDSTRFFSGKAVVTGYPVRAELFEVSRDDARRQLGLEVGETTLLVMGGSHGARSINRALVANLDALLPLAQIIHISGQLDWPWVRERALQLPSRLAARYRLFAYLHEEMPAALAAADLVLARAGASTLGELPALGLPGLLVPYPYAGRHQQVNAAYLAHHGAARILDDADLSTRLLPELKVLLTNIEIRQRMAAAAKSLARPQAALHIASELRQLAGK